MAIQLGIAIVVFGFLVLTVVDQWSEIQSKGVHFHVLWLIPAFVVLPIFYALSALGWDLILRFLGYRIGLGRAQVAWGQPLLARYVPGSVLYVLGRVLLSERAGVPRRITIASIVYEQAISAISAVGVAAYFFINHPDLQGQPLRWAVLLLVPLGIAILHPRVFGPLADRVLRAFGREPLPEVVSLTGVIVLLLFYACNWAVIAVGIYCVARSVSEIPAQRHPGGRLGAGGRLRRGADHARLPGRPRHSRRRLRLGGEGLGARQELRRRLTDRDRGARGADDRRADLCGDRDGYGAARGVVDPDRGAASFGRGAGGRNGGARDGDPHAGDSVALGGWEAPVRSPPVAGFFAGRAAALAEWAVRKT